MKRVALKPSTKPMKRGKPMARQRMKRTRPDGKGEFPETVKAQARRRSQNRCEARSSVCTGAAERFHHRKLKGMGGRSVDNRLVNCLHCCNSCHLYIHANPMMSYVLGWMVRSEHDPAEIAVKLGDGPRY